MVDNRAETQMTPEAEEPQEGRELTADELGKVVGGQTLSVTGAPVNLDEILENWGNN